MISRVFFSCFQKATLLISCIILSACGVSFYDRPTGESGNTETYPNSVDRQTVDGQVEHTNKQSEQQKIIQVPRSESGQSAASAIDQLLESAKQLLVKGQYEQAAAMAERTIRIAPRDPQGYFALAQISFFQGKKSLSQSLLSKAQTLAYNDANLLSAIDDFRRNNYSLNQ